MPSETSPCSIYDLRLGFDRYPFSSHELSSRLHRLFKKFVFQKEAGKESGYVHWQIRGSLWKKQRRDPARNLVNQVLNIFDTGDYYCEPTSNAAALTGNMFYVMKEDSRLEGPFSDKDQVAYIPRQYRVNLYPWQQAILNTADEFDPRTINLVVDPEGNHGKSILTGYAQCKGYYSFPTSLDANRLQESVCDILMSREDREPKLIFFDIPRSQNKKALGALFSAIEVVKSGIVCDTRYSFKQWMFDSPQIWVMTNEDLDLKLLSSDRWKVWQFDENSNLVQVK